MGALWLMESILERFRGFRGREVAERFPRPGKGKWVGVSAAERGTMVMECSVLAVVRGRIIDESKRKHNLLNEAGHVSPKDEGLLLARNRYS